MTRVALCLAAAMAARLVSAQFPPSPPAEPGQPPIAAGQRTAPLPGQPLRPGVAIDWPAQTVYASARVVLRSGPLEFFACRPGKEHESILLLDAPADDLYMALGLAGFDPGQPPRWDGQTQTYRPASGAPVQIHVRWTDERGAHEAPAPSWIEELEYSRPARDAPWLFSGSVRRDGVLLAERSGAVIALTDFSEALLSASQPHSSRAALLWAAARTDAIPPLDTPVTLIFRHPAPRAHTIRIGPRGDASVDGRFEPPAAVVDVIRSARRIDPAYVQRIELQTVLGADERRWRSLLESALPGEALRFVRIQPPAAGP